MVEVVMAVCDQPRFLLGIIVIVIPIAMTVAGRDAARDAAAILKRRRNERME